MTCQRCRGLMVKDHFFDLEESSGRPWIAGWRCLACGNILDPLIQRRRLVQALERERARAATGTDKTRRGGKPIPA